MSVSASRHLSCDPTAVATARRWTQLVLEDHHVGGPEHLVEDTLLCVSELVTNAVCAGCATIRLRLHVEPGCVRVSVHDDAPGTPAKQEPPPSDPHGRGLLIVDAIALDWGVEFAPSARRSGRSWRDRTT